MKAGAKPEVGAYKAGLEPDNTRPQAGHQMNGFLQWTRSILEKQRADTKQGMEWKAVTKEKKVLCLSNKLAELLVKSFWNCKSRLTG